ncbi:MAG: hypothetical protein CR965_01435 [Paludibacter sp.]|nr:MAG: hypothetical protein CR965_01435 [Paludibacter sp.]
MQELQLPKYSFRIKKINNGYQIFDEFRKKYVKLTPEEWVRQNFLRFLVEEKGFPKEVISVETELKVNEMKKRCDAIVYNKEGQPFIIIEFKAPNVPINQHVFDQAAVYNTQLNVDYFIMSNGLQHISCRVNKADASYDFFEQIPTYKELFEKL